MATVLHIAESALGDVLRLLAPFLGSGQVTATVSASPGAEEVDLAAAADLLGCDYFTARRIIIEHGLIAYRRKSSRAKSPILVQVADIEKYKSSLRVEPVVRKKRGRRSGTITATDIMLGS